jgi:hypothetical protein
MFFFSFLLLKYYKEINRLSNEYCVYVFIKLHTF